MNLVRNYGSGLDSVVASIIKRCAKDPNQPSTCSLTKHLRLSLRWTITETVRQVYPLSQILPNPVIDILLEMTSLSSGSSGIYILTENSIVDFECLNDKIRFGEDTYRIQSSDSLEQKRSHVGDVIPFL